MQSCNRRGLPGQDDHVGMVNGNLSRHVCVNNAVLGGLSGDRNECLSRSVVSPPNAEGSGALTAGSSETIFSECPGRPGFYRSRLTVWLDRHCFPVIKCVPLQDLITL